MKAVQLIKSGNRLVVDPTTPSILKLLKPQLSFQEKVWLRGLELRDAKRNGRMPFFFQDWSCYALDFQKRIACPAGLYWRIAKALEKEGYPTKLVDLEPHPKPEVYEPHWDRVFEYAELRPGGEDCLAQVLARPCGRINAATGFGKTFLIGAIANLWPRAKIDVTCPDLPAVDNIYRELSQAVADVGIFTSKRRNWRKGGSRVMVYSTKSLQHSAADADVLIFDEVHKASTEANMQQLMRYQKARCYGLTATDDMRADGTNLRVEAVFGPVIFSKSYSEALADGSVVPLEVRWRSVFNGHDPCRGFSDETTIERHGIWRNRFRNQQICKDARSYPAEEQTLIVCRTFEHAVHLKHMLPEFSLVYGDNEATRSAREQYIEQGLLPENEPVMTGDRRSQMQAAFEAGTLKKVIATTVWNIGVNFVNLPVLIRADGVASQITSWQIGGRLARLGKACGILHDYRDEFNERFRRRALTRSKHYKANGWRETWPEKMKTSPTLS